MHDTILQKVKLFLNVNIINLEKIKQEKCQPPSPNPPSLLRRPASAPYFHQFLIFQIPPSREGI